MDHCKIALAAFLVAAPTMAFGQPSLDPVEIGRTEYKSFCASCHGDEGRGDGAFGAYLTRKPSDLTGLSRNNGGVFPFARTFEVILGEVDVPGHGTREMPIWGTYFKERAPSQLGPYYAPSDVQFYVRGRILALIGYISTLQQK